MPVPESESVKNEHDAGKLPLFGFCFLRRARGSWGSRLPFDFNERKERHARIDDRDWVGADGECGSAAWAIASIGCSSVSRGKLSRRVEGGIARLPLDSRRSSARSDDCRRKRAAGASSAPIVLPAYIHE